MSEVTDLVVIEKANAMTVFQSADQIEEILQKVEREVMSFVPDITTAKGRKEIASLAYKVAQTKTYLDGLGKPVSNSARLQLGFSPLSKTIMLAKMRDVEGGRMRVGNDPGRDVTNEAAQTIPEIAKKTVW